VSEIRQEHDEPPRAEFPDTERFKILRRLGAGGMGVVYEAFDRERNARVALKTLRAMSANGLLDFKREFREFQDLSHANLVSYGELFAEDATGWFFTMELVEGVHFLDWVRPGSSTERTDSAGATNQLPSWFTPPPVSELQQARIRQPSGATYIERRLRQALTQLAQAMVALHETGRVHRDIKPSNILVTAEGRVVLLDFGLAVEHQRREDFSETEVVGTVDYMAPEQAAARPLGPEADWYAYGVLLFEALTGVVPFDGSAMEILMEKQCRQPPAPSTLVASVPVDLDQLCIQLLRFNPAERPTGRQVLERLGVRGADKRRGPLSIPSFTQSRMFIGREAELAQLGEAYEAVRRGETVTVQVHGESGLGKSALVRHFTDLLTTRDGAVVLAGRCYERETVPYKAVDGVIDALSRYMTRLSKAEAAAVLPTQAQLLAQVFPVLSRIEAVAEAPPTAEAIIDPQELRHRLFVGVRELLSRLAERQPLVLVIDDLQWADADSIALLTEVTRPPAAPPLLLIATVRTDQPSVADGGWSRRARHIQLGRMSPDESRALALALLQRLPEIAGNPAAAIAAEGQGHPLFIDELIRHAATVGSSRSAPLQLDDALWDRISQLDGEARRLLDITAVAGTRLVQKTAAQAAEMAFGDFAKLTAHLRVAHLARTSGMRATDFIEPYHDRVRTSVLAHLTDRQRTACHHRLAVALESAGRADPEALTVHWKEAGRPEKAAYYAVAAADKAVHALAFDRAVEFYRLGLELTPADSPQVGGLRARLGDAAANAGRGVEAAQAYLQAAEIARAADALDLRRRAAEQLLRSGHFADGITALRTVLSAVGEQISDTPARALLALGVRRLHLKVRGLKFQQRDERQLAPDDLTRLDTLWSAAAGLGMVDTIRGADFQTRHLLVALKAGEPYRIARALAMEAGFVSIGGMPAAARAAKLVDAATSLAHQVGHAHAIGLADMTAGIAKLQVGQWMAARQLFVRANAIFRERCTGVSWELATSQAFHLVALFYLGSFRTLRDDSLAMMTEASVRGDLYASTNARLSHMNLAWLLGGDERLAEEQIGLAMKAWSPEGYLAQHYYALVARVQLELYAGRGQEAWALAAREWRALEASLFMKVQFIRVEALHLRARAALAAAAVEPDATAAPMLTLADRAAHALEREEAPWAEALAQLLRAAVAARRQGPAVAIAKLERAAGALTALEMHGYAVAARAQETRLAGDAAGHAEALAALRRAGAPEPEALVRLLVPGF
jgi:serine/threonine protein kinase